MLPEVALSDGSLRTHSMVLMVSTIGSVLSLVQGTWICSSWMCPETRLKGSRSSSSSTSSLRSRLLKTASPPHKDTWESSALMFLTYLST